MPGAQRTNQAAAKEDAVRDVVKQSLMQLATSVETELDRRDLRQSLEHEPQPFTQEIEVDDVRYILKRVPRKLRLEPLSPRQEEVKRLLVEGEHRKGIAAELGISVRTVDTHIKRIFDRYGVDSNVELVRRVLLYS